MKAMIFALCLIVSFVSGFIISHAIDIAGAKAFLTYWIIGSGLAAVVLLSLLSLSRHHRSSPASQ